MSTTIKNAHKIHDPFAWVICSMLIGPFALLLLRFWKGLVLLALPVIFACSIAVLFLDSQVTSLLHYPTTLKVWGAIYWLVCIAAVIEEVKLQNRTQLIDDVHQNAEKSPVEQWLKLNPGKSVNDYYRYN
jgi:phosphoglycerol transferase MdoB-like AlkP superfamily enzyme